LPWDLSHAPETEADILKRTGSGPSGNGATTVQVRRRAAASVVPAGQSDALESTWSRRRSRSRLTV